MKERTHHSTSDIGRQSSRLYQPGRGRWMGGRWGLCLGRFECMGIVCCHSVKRPVQCRPLAWKCKRHSPSRKCSRGGGFGEELLQEKAMREHERALHCITEIIQDWSQHSDIANWLLCFCKATSTDRLFAKKLQI